jgi:hypothetical protein
MNGRHWTLGLLAVLSVLTAGCAGRPVTTQSTHSVSTPPGPGVSAGMAMPPGMSMPGMSPAGDTSSLPSSGTVDGPSASAQMVCGPEIRADIVTILALRPAPTRTTTWTDHLYTCTYHLPGGPLVLSVKESPDVTSANAYFTALRQRLGITHPLVGLAGLGNAGYDTSDGTVVVRKDDKVLKVDATGLPLKIGQHQQSRADLAYEVASDILGCWSGQ